MQRSKFLILNFDFSNCKAIAQTSLGIVRNEPVVKLGLDSRFRGNDTCVAGFHRYSQVRIPKLLSGGTPFVIIYCPTTASQWKHEYLNPKSETIFKF